jgi:HEAT repeat protein
MKGVRSLAAQALGEIGDPLAVAPLMAAVNGPQMGPVHLEAAKALVRSKIPGHPEWGYGDTAAVILVHAVLTTDEAVEATRRP